MNFKGINITLSQGWLLQKERGRIQTEKGETKVSHFLLTIQLTIYNPGHNCWNASRFLTSFLFNVDFQEVYSQVNPFKPTLGGRKGSHMFAVYTTQSSLLCFLEVFQRIMTVTVGGANRTLKKWAPGGLFWNNFQKYVRNSLPCLYLF